MPNDDLALIWELADVDDDGMLSELEFCVAMHLVFCRHAGELIPSELPPSLQQLLGDGPRAAQPSAAAAPPAAVERRPSLKAHFGAAMLVSRLASSVPFGACAAAASGTAEDPWEMKPADRAKYSGVFLKVLGAPASETVGGAEAHRFLARSKLPNDDLEVIWELADGDGDGRFSLDEFCTAMHLVTRRVAGDAWR